MSTVSILNTDAALSGKTLVTAEGAHTIDGLHTFDRDPNPPFAVSSGSAAVTNLDADKLDGQEGSYYRDASNLNAGIVPAARLPGSYNCIIYNSGTQAVANSTVTAVTFNAEDQDASSMHSTASNTDRVVIPSGADGLYLVVGKVYFPGTAGGTRQLRLGVSGTDLIVSAHPGGTPDSFLQIVGILQLTAGQYVNMSAYQDSGGPIATGHASARLSQNELRVVRLT